MGRVRFINTNPDEFIKKVQRKTGLSILELSKICRAHRRSFSDWRKGRYLMPSAVFDKLAERSGIKVSVERISDYWYIKDAARKGGMARYQKYRSFPGWSQEVSRRGGLKAAQTHKDRGSRFFVEKPILTPRHSTSLAEFIGILLGDGGITARQVCITLNKTDDREFVVYVKKLIEHLFSVRPSVYERKGENVLIIAISRTMLVRILSSMGLSMGNKVTRQAQVPLWIRSSNAFTKNCLRGLFDTDGCFFVDKHVYKEKTYENPGMNFTNRSLPLLQFFKQSMEKFGMYPKQTTKFSIFLRRENEIRRYFQQIGSSNPKHNKKFREYYEKKGGVPKWS